jgi:transcriptional regulator with XRE-family HTH domain
VSNADWKKTKTGQTWLRLYGHRKQVKKTRIAVERLRNGLSTSEAARLVGVSPPTWRGWELMTPHRRTPAGDMLAAILAGFPGLHIDDLTTNPFVYVEPQTLKVIE